MARLSGRRPTRRALAWLASLTPLFYASDGLANHLAGQRHDVPSVVFGWEHRVPFIAATIFPYWSINVFYALSLFLCRSRHELDRHGLRLATAQAIAVVFFIALPLRFTFGQPEASGAAGWLFGTLRGFDRPFNQAPSLHIALACILWDLYRRLVHGRFRRLLLHVWTVLICSSVLTTFQHHFIDIPTGALLGLVCIWLWPLERTASLAQAARWAGDPQRRRLALVYGLGGALVVAVAIALGGAALWLAWPGTALCLVACNYACFAEHGFAKRHDGSSGWAGRWMMAPYCAGAWLNSRWWTRDQPAARELAAGVWIGRMQGRADRRTAPFASVVDVSAELRPPPLWPTMSVPMLDLVVPAPARLRRAAHAIARQRAAHGSVLVCCALGYSRSAAAACTWLVAAGHARDAAAALDLVRARRPEIVVGAALRAAIDAACTVPPVAVPAGHAIA